MTLGKLILIITLAAICSACRSLKYVPIEKTVTKTEYRDRYVKDTTYQRDSVFIETRLKGDTVFVNRFKEKHFYHEVTRTDTMAVCDTVTIPKIVTVEKNSTTWQKVLMETGKWTIVIIIIALIGAITWMITRLKGRKD